MAFSILNDNGSNSVDRSKGTRGLLFQEDCYDNKIDAKNDSNHVCLALVAQQAY